MRNLTLISILAGLILLACQEDDEARCEDLTCFNGGVCVDGICDCPLGFTGFNCEIAEPCDSLLCQNGGTCLSGECQCPPGFTGLLCEDFDPCFDTECQNGGTCIDGDCECAPNYFGEFCQNQQTPATINIVKIGISGFPKYKNDGQPWDANSGPELIPEIALEGDILFSTLFPIVNANFGETYFWEIQPSIVINEVQSIHTFTLFDGDPNDELEEMGVIFFTPYVSQNDFPERLEFNADSIQLILDIEYTW
ncbi:MAG: calcium-binding EGF-like domain-containing protein [Flavobacteriales bacterium]|nr:calcium-binding EGF-like domain-containing protein [Flavobacteriales bacterium]